mmetsp:Transcript_33516/g.65888  ORF Transcript_33516/g.65888 Transcript_33516/m.65888 type:complete len:803 (-) Transcript_33516:48-2456(-)
MKTPSDVAKRLPPLPDNFKTVLPGATATNFETETQNHVSFSEKREMSPNLLRPSPNPDSPPGLPLHVYKKTKRGGLTPFGAISRDAKVVAMSENRTIILRDVQGKVLRKEELDRRPTACQFSPDNSLFAYGNHDSVVVRKLQSWSVVYTAEHSVFALEFSPDGSMLAYGSTSVVIRDVSSWGLLASFSDGFCFTVSFSNDGKRFLTGETEIIVREVGSWKTLAIFPVEGVLFVAKFSFCGKLLVSYASGDSEVVARDAVHGHKVLQTPSSMVFSVDFHPNNKLVLFVSENVGVTVSDLWTGAVHHHFEKNAAQAAFSNDGTKVVSICTDHVSVRDITSGMVVNTFEALAPVLTCSICPQRRLVASGEDRSLTLRDLATGKLIHTLHYPGAVQSCTFSADGRFVAYGGSGSSHEVQVAEVASGNFVRSFQHHEEVACCAISKNNHILIAGTSSRLTLRELASGTILWSVLFSSGIRSCVFCSMGASIAVAPTVGPLSHLDAKTGNVICEILAEESMTTTAAVFSPDDRYLAYGGFEFKAIIYDLKENAIVHDHKLNGFVLDISVSLDSKLVAVASAGKKVDVFDFLGGQKLRSWNFNQEATSLTFCTDCEFPSILAVSSGESVLILDVECDPLPGEIVLFSDTVALTNYPHLFHRSDSSGRTLLHLLADDRAASHKFFIDLELPEVFSLRPCRSDCGELPVDLAYKAGNLNMVKALLHAYGKSRGLYSMLELSETLEMFARSGEGDLVLSLLTWTEKTYPDEELPLESFEIQGSEVVYPPHGKIWQVPNRSLQAQLIQTEYVL